MRAKEREWSVGAFAGVLLALAGAARAEAPVAHDQKLTVLGGIETNIRAYYTDADTVSGFAAAVVSAPAHGSVTTSGSMPGYTYLNYTPDGGYAGTDSFTWKVNDGAADSNVATCELLVRSPGTTGGRTVLIVVKNTIQAEIDAELNQLRADIINDGYPAEIVVFYNSAAADLWNLLKGEYGQPGRFLAGAILVGQMPFARNESTDERTDYVYMNMEQYRKTTACNFHMWVSRMWALSVSGSELYFGDEVTLIKRALRANHEYRRGISGLPYNAYQFDDVFDPGQDEHVQALDVWPEAEFLSPRNAWVQAGDFIEEQTHGERASYDSLKVTSWRIHDMLAQIRWGVMCSCSSGYPGGVVNNQIFTRGGGNVMSVGATETTYAGYVMILQNTPTDNNLRALLAAGDGWGDALLVHQPFPLDTLRLVFYGDLSMKPMHGIENGLPVVDTLNASVTGGVEPLAVDFSGLASDADGLVTLYEWFPEGHQHGRIEPYVYGTTTVRHIYDKPHRYLARVEVVDDEKARGYKEVEIRVSPRTGQPVRVNCGEMLHWKFAVPDYYKEGLDYRDGSDKLWLHDQRWADGTWGWEGPNVGGQWTGDVLGTADDTLYLSHRRDYSSSGFTYKVPVENGDYTVNLGFADMANTEVGIRLIDVTLEGTPWLTAYDIVAQAGADTAITVSTSVTVSDGLLELLVETNAASTDPAILNCLEVVPASGDNKRPVAVLGATPISGAPPLNVTFTSTGSYDPDGALSSYEWDFGDGVTDIGPSTSHEYSSGGVYSAILKVTDGAGVSACDHVTVRVGSAGNTAPVAADQFETTWYNTPLSITLAASDADGDPLVYVKLTDPPNGTLTGTAPDYVYTPNVNYSGDDSFTWKANDGTDDSNVAVFTVTVLPPGSDETVTLDAVEDTFLHYTQPDSPHDENSYGLWIDSYIGLNEEGRTLIRFDLTGVPAGSTVLSAILQLYCFRETGAGGGNDTMEVVRCGSPWLESSATYTDHANNGSAAYATVLVPQYPDAGGNMVDPPQLLEMDITSLVQDWVDGSFPNYGMRLWGNDGAFDTRWVDSEDTPGKGAQYAPKLVVSYGDGGPSDTTPPTGSISVDGGAASTTDLLVSLDLAADDAGGSGVTQMKFSNDGGTWSSWETYATVRTDWDLSSFGGDAAFGTKTVRAQYRDASGNISATYSDAIDYVDGGTGGGGGGCGASAARGPKDGTGLLLVLGLFAAFRLAQARRAARADGRSG